MALGRNKSTLKTGAALPKGPKKHATAADHVSPLKQPQLPANVPRAADDFSIQADFKGYRNKEDITNLPPGYLVKGSQNVLTTTASRLSIRKGYTKDGTIGDPSILPILSAFDWDAPFGQARHLKVGNNKLFTRFVAADSTVTWLQITTATLASSQVNFTTFWDPTHLQGVILFVDGSSNIYEWDGGTTTFASATANTITKQGSTTWGQENFYIAGTRSVEINGVVYTYTGGEGTTTITGVAPDPTIQAFPVGTPIFQTVRITANAATDVLPATLANQVISTLDNQIWVGSLTNQTLFVSKQNDYKTYTVPNPRVPGDPIQFQLDAAPVGLILQEETMYATFGKDFWTGFTSSLSADLVNQSWTINRLKTSRQQAARSQSAIFKDKNDVIFIDNEPALDSLGRVQAILQTPQASNISDPIKNDFDSYDFTDSSGIYFRYFYYVAVPKQSIVRVWNVEKQWWEAPLIMPISRFSVINGELYGHSYQTLDTYKLFVGYNDNGNLIKATAAFSFQNFGTRTHTKMFEDYYTEGYISPNTNLTLGIQYEIDGCATSTSYTINGSDSQIVCLLSDNAGLGKVPLGKNPLGGILNNIDPNLPPKFRVIKTFPPKDFYECQISYSSEGKDFHWEILANGPRLIHSPYDNSAISQ